MRARHFGTVLAVLLVAGCSASVVTGTGQLARTPSGTSSHDFPSGSGSVPSPSESSAAPTGPYARTPAATPIGDPVTADFCAAIGLQSFAGIGSGVTASFEDQQYLPGCAIDIARGSTRLVGLDVVASNDEPKAASGRTSRVVAGLTVYVYPYDSAISSCERQVAVTGLTLAISSYQLGSTAPDETTVCRATDIMADRTAQAVASRSLPRLAVATPSITALDACKVVTAARITSLSVFGGGRPTGRSFGAACNLRPTSKLFLYVNFVVAGQRMPAGSRPVTVAGHTLYPASGADDRFCTVASTQGTTSDGKYEQVVIASDSLSGDKVSGLCQQTQLAMVRFLDTAGLH